MNNRLPVSVLIPTMNRPETLDITLKSYMSADYIPEQIVVVDQSQDKEIAEQVKSVVLEYSEKTNVVYKYLDRPSSSIARNICLNNASEELLVWSDDDIDVYANTLKNVIDVFENKKIAMVAGIHGGAKVSESKIGYLLGTKSFRYRKIGHVTKSVLGRFPNGHISKQISTMWAMGFFFITRKSLVESGEIYWEESFVEYAYAEDLDFSFRYYLYCEKMGYNCVVDPLVTVIHRSSQEYRIPSKKHTYYYVINRWFLSYKWGWDWTSRLAMIWCDFWKWVQRLIKKQNPKDLVDAYRFVLKNKKSISTGKVVYPAIEECK